MLTLDAAQIWAVIGVLAAAFFGMMTLMSTLFVRVIRAEIGNMDRDIQFLMRREHDRDAE